MKRVVSCLIVMAFLVLLIPRTAQAKLNKRDGVNCYKGTKETYYNLPMVRIFAKADANFGKHHKKYVREDGVWCYGPYVVLAVPFDVYPYGTCEIETSLGPGIALDTGAFAETCKNQVDVAVTW